MPENYTIAIKNFNYNKSFEQAHIDIDAKSILFFDVYDIKKSNIPVASYNIHFAQTPDIEDFVKFCDYTFGPTESMNNEIYKVQIQNRGKTFDFYIVQDAVKYLETLKRKHISITKKDVVLNHNLERVWPRKTLTIPSALIDIHKRTKQRQ